MDSLKVQNKSNYPERFQIEVLRMAVVIEGGEIEFHVIPLIKPKEIGQTIYHGYQGQDLSIPVQDLLNVFRKDITEDKADGVWFIYCYAQDRLKAKQILFDAVNEDTKENLMLTMSEEPLPDFELELCDKCVQMTNHLNGVCQKCKDDGNNK